MAEPQTSLSQANHALVEHAHAADEARAVIIKAHVVGSGDVQSSAAIQAVEASERTFGELGALPPPFDPDALCVLFENSSALRPNVDAYCANIDAHGHRFEPVLDFDAEDAVERVAAAVYAERLWLQEHGKLTEALQPTKEEATALVKALDAQARIEKIRLDNWSEFCCADNSLVAVRRQTRMDLETLGNGYWEILRNIAGELALIVHVPGFTVRLLPLDPTPVQVEMRVKVSPISYQTIQIARCFRRYVQVVEGMPPVYFKELGDPRVVSRKTGKVFESLEAMQREDETDQPATEILHFKVHSPRSAYGVPRWMGTLLEVLGSRQAAEVNFFYFQNKSVPPLALLVSGGRLSQSSVPRIERFIEEHIKGKKNFHKILIIEAESTRTASNERAGRISLEFHPLTSAQQTDAMFQHYDERNIDKIGAAFRLPRLLRGDIRDFNRSTALAALHFAEEQIFQPERQEFDFLINRKILADMGIRFWRFCSNAPVTRDPQIMAETVKNLVTANVLTPEEGRRLAGDVFNIEFRAIRAPWVKQPIPLTLAGFPVESDKQTEMLHSSVPSQTAAPAVRPVQDASVAHAAGAGVEAVGADAHERFLRLKPEQMERDVIYVPDEELASWLEPEPTPTDGQEDADA